MKNVCMLKLNYCTRFIITNYLKWPVKTRLRLSGLSLCHSPFILL